MTYSRIAGTGRYLPERVLTNADMEKIVDTTDEWIRTRTGIEERHVATEDEQTSDLCVEAAKVAMADAGVEPQDIDLRLWRRIHRPVYRPGCERGRPAEHTEQRRRATGTDPCNRFPDRVFGCRRR